MEWNSRAREMTVHRRDAETLRKRREEKRGRNGFNAKFEG
jgi:hypothetical protein